MAVSEGVGELALGRTFALPSYPEHPELFRRCAFSRVRGLLLLLASPSRGECRRFALALPGCPLLPATSGSCGAEPRQRRVAPTAPHAAASGFSSGGAHAPHPGGASGTRPTRSCARPRRLWYTSYPLLRPAPVRLPSNPPASRLGREWSPRV